VVEIWKAAEDRLGVSREKFALVVNSRYLPETGTLAAPEQLFEVRRRGRGGGKQKNKDPGSPLQIFFRWQNQLEKLWIRPSKTLKHAFEAGHFILGEQNRITGGDEELTPDRLDITFREYFGGARPCYWDLYISGPSPMDVEQEEWGREIAAECARLDAEEEEEAEEPYWRSHPERGSLEPPVFTGDSEEDGRRLAAYRVIREEWEGLYKAMGGTPLTYDDGADRDREAEEAAEVGIADTLSDGGEWADGDEGDRGAERGMNTNGRGIISVSRGAGLVWVSKVENWTGIVERALGLSGEN
jgi:hypothetical protein